MTILSSIIVGVPKLSSHPPRARRCNRYASCPELNEVLHLHCKGIAEVTNLEDYTGLKAGAYTRPLFGST